MRNEKINLIGLTIAVIGMTAIVAVRTDEPKIKGKVPEEDLNKKLIRFAEKLENTGTNKGIKLFLANTLKITRDVDGVITHVDLTEENEGSEV